MAGKSTPRDNFKRKVLITGTVTQDRFGLFEASRKPLYRSDVVSETFSDAGDFVGRVSVIGRLGQTHEDLLEIVNYYCCMFRVNDKRLEVVVDPNVIRRKMGRAGKYSQQVISTLEDDLLSCVIQIENRNGGIKFKAKSHIVEVIHTAESLQDEDPEMAQMLIKENPWAGKKTGLMGISNTRSLQLWRFSQEWTEMLGTDIALDYDPILIRNITIGSVAAMARYILSQKNEPNGGWIEKNIIARVKTNRRHDKVQNEIDRSCGQLINAGIIVDANRRWHLLKNMSTEAPRQSTKAPNESAKAPAMSAKAPEL